MMDFSFFFFAFLVAFLYQVHKFFIVVQLLLGEIPERSLFRQPMLKKALVPYLHITQGKEIKNYL